MPERNNQIVENILHERAGLWRFIRKRIFDKAEAEDVLQDVWGDFVEAYHLPEPIEQIGAWLYRVARNRIIDRSRKKKELSLPEWSEEATELWLDGFLPVVDGPETAYIRQMWLEELQLGLNELPAEQRDVFIAHELEGRSFEELVELLGVNLNTLLARKRYAVLHLRQRMQVIYDEFLQEDWL